MLSLRWFMRDQLELAHTQLEEILLLEPGSADDKALPALNLRNLKDDPVVKTPGWSFLLDERNSQLHGYDRWLLNRVCEHGRLRKRFLASSSEPIKWRKKAAECYLQQVDAFLCRLLLLVHMSAGQPARATELLTIQWRNAANGIGAAFSLKMA